MHDSSFRSATHRSFWHVAAIAQFAADTLRRFHHLYQDWLDHGCRLGIRRLSALAFQQAVLVIDALVAVSAILRLVCVRGLHSFPFAKTDTRFSPDDVLVIDDVAGLTSRRSQPPLALSVPLSRWFTLRSRRWLSFGR